MSHTTKSCNCTDFLTGQSCLHQILNDDEVVINKSCPCYKICVTNFNLILSGKKRLAGVIYFSILIMCAPVDWTRIIKSLKAWVGRQVEEPTTQRTKAKRPMKNQTTPYYDHKACHHSVMYEHRNLLLTHFKVTGIYFFPLNIHAPVVNLQ